MFQTNTTARNSQWFKFSAKNSLQIKKYAVISLFREQQEKPQYETYQRFEFTHTWDAAHLIQAQALLNDATTCRGR